MLAKTPLSAAIVGWVGLEDVIPLRHRVLREGLPIATARFDADDDTRTKHAGVHLADTEGSLNRPPVCCVSLMRNSYNRVPAWQVRGMATDHQLQGRGLGTQLLDWVQRELQHEPTVPRVKLMWCNAREAAVDFYEKNGWLRSSNGFDIKGVGWHFEMTKNF